MAGYGGGISKQHREFSNVLQQLLCHHNLCPSRADKTQQNRGHFFKTRPFHIGCQRSSQVSNSDLERVQDNKLNVENVFLFLPTGMLVCPSGEGTNMDTQGQLVTQQVKNSYQPTQTAHTLKRQSTCAEKKRNSFIPPPSFESISIKPPFIFSTSAAKLKFSMKGSGMLKLRLLMRTSTLEFADTVHPAGDVPPSHNSSAKLALVQPSQKQEGVCRKKRVASRGKSPSLTATSE